MLRIDPDLAADHKVVWRLGLTNLSDEQWDALGKGPPPLEIIGDTEGQFCGQHGTSLLPNGHLILFDNGVLCMQDPWRDTQLLARPGGTYSRAVEYALDVDNGEAVFLRDHSLGGTRSRTGHRHGHVEELDNGDWLIGWGGWVAGVGAPPKESVTQVDPDTGEEKFSIALLQTDGSSDTFRPIPLPPAALADDPVPLRAEFLDSGTSSFHAQGGPRPTVVIAFNQPVGDFENDTPSLDVQGATLDSVDPYFVSGESAHAYRITLIPDSAASISISLLAGQNCADSGICTADGGELVEALAARTIYPAVTVSFGQTTYDAPEGSSISIALMLSSDPERTIEIPLTFTEQGGASSADYSDVPNPTIIAGETEASFTFSPTQDTIDDDGEKVKLGFGALPAGMTASGTTEATVSITDDDASPELILAAPPAAIVEAGGSAMVTVEITNGVTFAEDQEIALSFAGTATKGTDYTVALESLTLTAGQSSVATTVTAVQDRVDDDAETILITASHGGGTIGAEQTITIIDDDAAPAVTTCSGGMAGTYPCSNVDLMSFLALDDIGGGSANDIWGWTDSSTGKEYAIMGRTTGTSFVDISDPVNPIYLGNLPSHSVDSEWRDVKVYADHAFIVTEANNSGMQVFDLTQLRMVASPPAAFSETAHYPHFSDAHNLAINEDSGFAYAVGTNNCSGGLHMINIQTPTNPASAGCFSGDGYTHDAQCVNYDGPDLDHQGKEICFNSNEDTLTIVDVTNKAAPVMLSRTGYSGSRYTHQGWLTEDQVYFLLGDELDETDNPDVTNTRTYMWDVSDLDDPALIGSHDATTTAIDHNQYVKGNYTYQSNYQAGLRILDITDIANGNLTEAAFFDFNPGSDPTNTEGGTWSNYPFFDSGIVIVSVIEQGLFILRPNLVDGVKPALASAAVNGAALTLTYGEVLDGNSTPATDAFTVTVAGSGRMVTHVSVSGRVVTLTLASAVAHGEAVTVSYSPGTNPIQDAVGNDAGGLSNDPVRNDTPDTTAPAVSSLAVSSNPGSDQTYAAGEEIEVTVTFDETVEVTGTPQLSLELGGGSRTATYEGGSGTAALVFAYEVADGDEDTGGVRIEAGRIALNGGTIEDEADNNAELDHDGLAADSGHKVDAVKPELAASGGAVVNGTTLTLTYDEPLDGSSTPATGDFTVSGGDRTRTVTGVRVNGSAVELTLDGGAEHGEAGIQVSYTPGDNPIQDVPGNDAEALSREPVTNDTPDTTPPTVESLAITSNPGSDQTYAEGDEIEVTVTFSETVEVEETPQLRLRVGTRTRTAGYDNGTGTAALVFSYEVAAGDEDNTDGVSIEAGRIALNGGTIEDEAENAAVLDHEAVAPQAGHQVDGIRPAFLSAAVDGSSLTLTYKEALDPGSRPAPGDFTVQVDGSGRSVSGVSVSGTVVTLTLNPAVEHGDTGIRVSYTPDTNPLRDVVGNDALGLSSQSVTNTTDAPNAAPQITSPSSFDVPENQTLARRLTARDDDDGDEVTGWAIVGGADQGQFTITSDTGELSFRTAPDFEGPGDNEYEVTVEVRSGAGARELEAEQTFTLRVTDEREPPGIPETPIFSGETADSLTVNWSEPDNTGPAISDYDVQYREKGTGRFIDGQHAGPGLSLTLDDLEPGTVYEVQVRATNDEGRSNWSESGEGMTVMPLTVQMTSDIEPPVEGPFTVRFSFSEPVRGFSTSDIETGQDPACMDDQNTPVFCGPAIGGLETVDDRIFTTTVTPLTDGVAHNYTLTITVPANAVTSVVDNKSNEAAALEVRVAPPGVTAAISTIGLRASPGNGRVTLRWNTPANNGGASIIRYEYRWGESGGEFSEWIRVAPAQRSAPVPDLTNGTEYVFEVRAVNALGYGGVETVRTTPSPSTGSGGSGGGGGGGGGGPRQTVPDTPTNVVAEGTDGAVVLTWEAPEDDGGAPITDYEYRIDGKGQWISIGSTDTTHTVTGLVNDTAYVFQVRAVNRVGRSPASDPVEATPRMPVALDFTHFTNGGLITSDLVLVNAGAAPTQPTLYFYDQKGHLMDPDSVVDITGDLMVTADGALTIQTDMEPLGELTIATHGRGDLVSGSVKVVADGPIGGFLRFDIPGLGVAGVGASPPVQDAIFPARRQAGGIRTAAALHNLEAEAMGVSCHLMRAGVALEAVEIPLEANGQTAWFIEDTFTATDTADFLGSVRCTAPGTGRFTAIAAEIDATGGIFTTVPVVEVNRGRAEAATLDFAHFANGTWITDLVFVNLEARQSGPDLTPFHTAIPPSRPAIYFYDTEGNPIAPTSVVDITGDLMVTADGALTVQTAMEPLGVLTISTHGRGELVSGSVKVVSDGPIGGMVRFGHPALGVAGVGASPPVSDAVFPVRRQDGGITTGFAIHNLESSPGLVRCELRQAGVLLDAAVIPLEANGQTARLIDAAFPGTDTSDFSGSVRCTATGKGLFTAVALELDAGTRTFITVPVVPVIQ